MICPKCKTQYDVYNAEDRPEGWVCPVCKVELNDSDASRWGVLKVLENHNYDYWELNALKDNCQKKDFSIIWDDPKSLPKGEEQTALIYFRDEYVLDVVSFLADIRGSIDYVEDGFVQEPLTWYRNDLVFGIVVKASGTIGLVERLNRSEKGLEEKK